MSKKYPQAKHNKGCLDEQRENTRGDQRTNPQQKYEKYPANKKEQKWKTWSSDEYNRKLEILYANVNGLRGNTTPLANERKYNEKQM